MSLRLIPTSGQILLYCSKLYEVGGGEVPSSYYKITKGGIDIPIEDIDIDENTFKISEDPVTGKPYSQLILGEEVDVSYYKFPLKFNVSEVGYDNVYKMNIELSNLYYDEATMTSKIRRKIDLLEVFNIKEGLYHTDTGYMIIISDNYLNVVECPFSKIYNLRPDLEDDGTGKGGVYLWQLANMRREAFNTVMNDIEIFKDDIGQNFKLLNIDPIMELVALKTISTYEEHHEKDNLLKTYKYNREIKKYKPEYRIDSLGGNLQTAKVNRVKF